MKLVTATRCPECGHACYEVIDPDLDVVLVCSNDDCQQIIVSVVRSLA